MGLDILEILSRISATLLFSVVLGYERGKHQKAAGITTHSLVAISTAAIAMLQVELYNDGLKLLMDYPELVTAINPEKQRLIAAVITGIGFLGGGAILKTKNEVIGLTTAATLWTCGIVGIIFGMGYYLIGLVVSIFILILTYGVKTYVRNKYLEHENYDNH